MLCMCIHSFLKFCACHFTTSLACPYNPGLSLLHPVRHTPPAALEQQENKLTSCTITPATELLPCDITIIIYLAERYLSVAGL